MGWFTPIDESAVIALVDSLHIRSALRSDAVALVHRCLHMATRAEKTVCGVTVPRGTVVASLEAIYKPYGITRQTCRTLIKRMTGPFFMEPEKLTNEPTNVLTNVLTNQRHVL